MRARITSERRRCGVGCRRRAITVGAISVALMSGCASMGGSVTERALCDELRRDLPSWSRADTAQSRREGADFLDTFAAACPR